MLIHIFDNFIKSKAYSKDLIQEVSKKFSTTEGDGHYVGSVNKICSEKDFKELNEKYEKVDILLTLLKCSVIYNADKSILKEFKKCEQNEIVDEFDKKGESILSTNNEVIKDFNKLKEISDKLNSLKTSKSSFGNDSKKIIALTNRWIELNKSIMDKNTLFEIIDTGLFTPTQLDLIIKNFSNVTKSKTKIDSAYRASIWYQIFISEMLENPKESSELFEENMEIANNKFNKTKLQNFDLQKPEIIKRKLIKNTVPLKNNNSYSIDTKIDYLKSLSELVKKQISLIEETKLIDHPLDDNWANNIKYMEWCLDYYSELNLKKHKKLILMLKKLQDDYDYSLLIDLNEIEQIDLNNFDKNLVSYFNIIQIDIQSENGENILFYPLKVELEIIYKGINNLIVHYEKKFQILNQNFNNLKSTLGLLGSNSLEFFNSYINKENELDGRLILLDDLDKIHKELSLFEKRAKQENELIVKDKKKELEELLDNAGDTSLRRELLIEVRHAKTISVLNNIEEQIKSRLASIVEVEEKPQAKSELKKKSKLNHYIFDDKILTLST